MPVCHTMGHSSTHSDVKKDSHLCERSRPSENSLHQLLRGTWRSIEERAGFEVRDRADPGSVIGTSLWEAGQITVTGFEPQFLPLPNENNDAHLLGLVVNIP